MRITVLFLVVVSVLLVDVSGSYFGNKRKKEKQQPQAGEFPDENKAKDTIDEGVDTLLATAQDPKLLKDAMAALKDPSTMKEVEKLMSDPAFIREMEKIKSDPQFASSVQSAKELYNDAAKAAKTFGELGARANKGGLHNGRPSDAQLGMSELAKIAKNPQMMADALQMLKDPETVAEVM